MSHPSWGMAAGALCVSASAVLISLSHTSPGTASVYRCVLALPFLALFAVRERRSAGPPPRTHQLRAAVAGALFSGDMLLWTQAIAEVGAGLSTVIVNLQVVLVPWLAWLVDREPVTRRFLLAVPVVLVGVILTSGVVGESGVGTDPFWGTVHAALAALCYAGFLFLLRRGGQEGQPIQSYGVATASAAAVSAVVGTLWQGVDPTPGWVAVGWLLLVALCGQVVGWLLVAVCSPRLPSHVSSVLLLLTPVGALALGAIVLAERPAPAQLLGCVLILGSVALVTSRAPVPSSARS